MPCRRGRVCPSSPAWYSYGQRSERASVTGVHMQKPFGHDVSGALFPREKSPEECVPRRVSTQSSQESSAGRGSAFSTNGPSTHSDVADACPGPAVSLGGSKRACSASAAPSRTQLQTTSNDSVSWSMHAERSHSMWFHWSTNSIFEAPCARAVRRVPY